MSTQEENSTLHFVDAHGKWYDVDIDTDVAKHEYDWKYLVNDGQNISYEGNPSYQIRKGVDVSKFPGNLTCSYRSIYPLKIIGEEIDFTNRTDEEISQWKEKLADNKGEIIN